MERLSDMAAILLPLAGIGMLIGLLTLYAVHRQRHDPLQSRGRFLIGFVAAIPTLVAIVVFAVSPTPSFEGPRPDGGGVAYLGLLLWPLVLFSPLFLFDVANRLTQERHLGWRCAVVVASVVQLAIAPLIVLGGAQALSATPL